MFKEFFFLNSEVLQGKSILRALLNWRLLEEKLVGKTIDIGGGKNADYISFMKKINVEFETFDMKAGDNVNFEKDVLPCEDGRYDTVLFLNVLEHIYNYKHIASEVVRVIKPKGSLIGFVPFLMWYHPDHRDFFRYTHEALEKIFSETGIRNFTVVPVSKGPFLASLHIRLFSYPRIIRPITFSIAYMLDTMYLRLKVKEGGHSRYIIGYLFKGDK